MSWLRGHLGSIAMALALAVLTWLWLYSESTAKRQLDFDFQPRQMPELAHKRYEVRGAEMIDDKRLRVDITGPRGVVETLRPFFRCEPVVDASRFTADQGTVEVALRQEDFPLPPNVRVSTLPEVTIHYVKFLDRTVAVQIAPSDVEGELPPGLRVAEIRPTPPSVRVRVPANLVDKLPPSLPIEKVRLSGHTSTFHVLGRLQTAVPGLPGLRQAQDFSLEVVLDRVMATWTVKDVPLRLAGPDAIVNRLRLKSSARIDISVEGPPEFQKDASAKDFFAYVRADHLDPENDLKTSPIVLKTFGCEIDNPKLRPYLRVVAVMAEAQPENRQAEVIVLPENR